MAGKTMAEKLLSRNAGVDAVAGDIVVGNLDLAISHDGNRPLPVELLAEMGTEKVWDPSKYVIFLDHYPSPTEAVAAAHATLRQFAAEQGCHLYEVGEGISHIVMAERGHVAPGDVVIGADSHTCTSGALGAFATGVGSSDLAAGMATGKLWFQVPETLKIVCHGAFGPGVSAKDLALYVTGKIGADGATYLALEYGGEAIANMGMDGRFTLANLAVEAGAKVGLVPPDEVTRAWLEPRLKRVNRPYEPVFPDDDATYADVIEIDVSELAPQVSLPHNVDKTANARDLGDIPVHQVVIGTCNAARLDDLAAAARILGGKKIASHVRCYVTPPSREIYAEAMRQGIIQTLVEAGAVIGTPGCSGCVGGSHWAVPANGENVLTTANRNFRGRLGNPQASMYLASAATAAASALTGRITDPSEVEGATS